MDAPFKMLYTFSTRFSPDKSRCFFTTNAPSAVHEHFFCHRGQHDSVSPISETVRKSLYLDPLHHQNVQFEILCGCDNRSG
mmetsp:Transcript_8736/g.12860  ORF Transcript_8736/g.12860 Transcript_8736/m.12860 type:complete len:81 (+) Transcript_8736:2671-2913(+)